ncbi:MAG: sigma-70 family RNA polymerase sigma factor [Nocardioidaceae bacterium]|nr:sigma-70 family RNA polymerase sigma factor [Nocardioidaceae bacterium]
MTDVPAGPTDAELVSRVLHADREAFAAVYDRYGDRLHDFAYSMLRQREDAADAVADSFVTFAERLPQLRDPDRLRPWLYAIVRSECLRRLKARTRFAYGEDERMAEMADSASTPEQEASRLELQRLVWDAAAGLAERDRALLDLHLRQGLEGAELAEAMGVSASNGYVMLNRVKAQVERSLGALLIARLGRDDCTELSAILAGWDGSFSPLVRKRVARHVDGCDICGERRKVLVSPLALLAAVPIVAAPLALRDRVLEDTELVAYVGPGDGAAGGAQAAAAPVETVGPRRGRRRALAAAAAVVLIGGSAYLFWPAGDDEKPVSALPQTLGGAPTSGPATPAPPTSTPATPTAPASTPLFTAGPPTAVTPSGPPLAPGALTLDRTTLDLGSSGTRGSVTLGNSGGQPISFLVAPDASWLRASPATGILEGTKTSKVSLQVDRSKIAEGDRTATLYVSWDNGKQAVQVRLSVDHAPQVGTPTASTAPSCGQPSVPVSVRVTDESRLRSVRLTWTGPNGAGAAAMARQADGRWSAQMGPFTLGGPVSFKVTAVDVRGNKATGPAGSVEATPCPQ